MSDLRPERSARDTDSEGSIISNENAGAAPVVDDDVVDTVDVQPMVGEDIVSVSSSSESS